MENIMKWNIKIDNRKNQDIIIQYDPNNPDIIYIIGEYGVKGYTVPKKYIVYQKSLSVDHFLENIQEVLYSTYLEMEKRIENINKIGGVLDTIKNIDIIENESDTIVEKSNDIYGYLEDDIDEYVEI